ncbi:hypothetical protein HWQ67_04830 [Candidatus Magnetobacterium casensis]|uniref:Uncharacterized protein n=1 Tax=Candidatus Magnetobacterium casense TaxID=1455061 RepID=A0ABS6RWD6_9BACT|nr:hypothetical protein [Candidatus Magnetobacterium casensis]
MYYSGGNVGVGMSNPIWKFYVANVSADGYPSWDTWVDTTFLIESDRHTVLQLLSPKDWQRHISFADSDSRSAGGILYFHHVNRLSLYSKFRLD